MKHFKPQKFYRDPVHSIFIVFCVSGLLLLQLLYIVNAYNPTDLLPTTAEDTFQTLCLNVKGTD